MDFEGIFLFCKDEKCTGVQERGGESSVIIIRIKYRPGVLTRRLGPYTKPHSRIIRVSAVMSKCLPCLKNEFRRLRGHFLPLPPPKVYYYEFFNV